MNILAIKLELISSPPGHPLASGVTEGSILRAAIEIGALHVNRKVRVMSIRCSLHIICMFTVAKKSQARTRIYQRSNG
jgi:hypothetical protein